MTRRGADLRVARLLVATAARIVGRRQRSEWRREWEAELSWAAERGRPLVRDALGAFNHALTVRGHALVDTAGASMVGHLRFSWLDVKLGLRMLIKYPGLSSISVLGISVAIAIGAGTFSIMAALIEGTLPVPDGERVVALRNAIITEPGRNTASYGDFVVWRDDLESVQDLAAFTTVARNLVAPGVPVDLVRVARMTASGFRVARTAPLVGRPLLEEDERTDARVVVIGFEEWQRRFAADPDIIGRQVRLGGDVYTIVGVMPEGFRFPVDDGYWIPFVMGPAASEHVDEVTVTIVGRLSDGETLERARAELRIIGTRMAAEYPETHRILRPRVVLYTRAFFDMDSPEQIWTVSLFQVFISLLLVVVAVNVAILVYARTATRAGEIAVRTALGASRARVVAQLFAEALVVCGIAAVVGLMVAAAVLGRLQALAERELSELPFWVNLGLSPGVVTYVIVLATVGAAITGVLPALKATGQRVQGSLQRLSGRDARMQLGRAWTALIVVQVAVAVAVLPFAAHFAQEQIALAAADAGYPADEFLEASLAMGRAGAPQELSEADDRIREQRFRDRATELIQRIESDPAVAGVTFRMPAGDIYCRSRRCASGGVEVEAVPTDGGQRSPLTRTERIDRVAAGFFALQGMPILAGRAFDEGDSRAGGTAVIVNEVFVQDALGDGAVLGRRIRLVRQSETAGEVEAGPWLAIVGVVDDFEGQGVEPSGRIYLPADIAGIQSPIHLAVRVRGDTPMSLARRLRDSAAAVDPELQLDGLISAGERRRQSLQLFRNVAIATITVMLSVLFLSAAGIYALMSFTVAKRRREIGIRSALGADPHGILRSIFARASGQLAAGMLLGLTGTLALDRMTGKGPVRDGNPVALVVVVALMTTAGLLAALGPARRGLSVQPTEAIREE